MFPCLHVYHVFFSSTLNTRLDRQQLTPNDVGEIEIDDDDVTILKTELVSMAIRALQKDEYVF